jgi:L-asparagine transporter-like permease
MWRVQFVLALIFLIMAAVILALVNDSRAIYSGGFFTVLGIWLFIKSRRKRKAESADEKE